MLRQSALWLGLFMAGAFLTEAGLAPLAMMLFPVPAAVFWACGRRGSALMTLAWAGVSVLAGYGLRIALLRAAGVEPEVFGMGWLVVGFAAALVASGGVVLGGMIRSGSSFGRCVAALSLLYFGLIGAETAVLWDQTRDAWTVFMNARTAELEEAGNTAMAELLRWFDGHWAYVGFGMLYSGLLLAVSLQAVVVFRWLRANPDQAAGVEPNGQFKTMRPPEWLVWLAIAAALLWLADNRWPNETVRFVSWNTAMALFTVYWLNGLGIALCGLQAFGARAGMQALLLGLLFLSGMHQGLAVFGLFDTWFEHRIALARLAAAWRERNRDRDG